MRKIVNIILRLLNVGFKFAKKLMAAGYRYGEITLANASHLSKYNFMYVFKPICTFKHK